MRVVSVAYVGFGPDLPDAGGGLRRRRRPDGGRSTTWRARRRPPSPSTTRRSWPTGWSGPGPSSSTRRSPPPSSASRSPWPSCAGSTRRSGASTSHVGNFRRKVLSTPGFVDGGRRGRSRRPRPAHGRPSRHAVPPWRRHRPAPRHAPPRHRPRRGRPRRHPLLTMAACGPRDGSEARPRRRHPCTATRARTPAAKRSTSSSVVDQEVIQRSIERSTSHGHTNDQAMSSAAAASGTTGKSS